MKIRLANRPASSEITMVSMIYSSLLRGISAPERFLSTIRANLLKRRNLMADRDTEAKNRWDGVRLMLLLLTGSCILSLFISFMRLLISRVWPVAEYCKPIIRRLQAPNMRISRLINSDDIVNTSGFNISNRY